MADFTKKWISDAYRIGGFTRFYLMPIGKTLRWERWDGLTLGKVQRDHRCLGPPAFCAARQSVPKTDAHMTRAISGAWFFFFASFQLFTRSLYHPIHNVRFLFFTISCSHLTICTWHSVFPSKFCLSLGSWDILGHQATSKNTAAVKSPCAAW